MLVVSLLLAAVCLIPAAGKLAGHPKMRHAAAGFGIPWARYRLIGIAELAAAGGVIAGLVWRPIGVAAGIGMACCSSAPSRPTGERTTPLAKRHWRWWPSPSPPPI